MTDTLLWALSVILILLGLAGIVLPALPGTFLVLAGIALGAWIACRTDPRGRVGRERIYRGIRPAAMLQRTGTVDFPSRPRDGRDFQRGNQ